MFPPTPLYVKPLAKKHFVVCNNGLYLQLHSRTRVKTAHVRSCALFLHQTLFGVNAEMVSVSLKALVSPLALLVSAITDLLKTADELVTGSC